METINGNRYTLGEFIMKLTDPINPTSGVQKMTRLFNSVDYATQGRDRDNRTMYLIAYEMQETLAGRVVDILPCLVYQERGEIAVKAWFHTTALHMIHTPSRSTKTNVATGMTRGRPRQQILSRHPR